MSVLPVKMTESRGRSFRLFEIGALGVDSSTRRKHKCRSTVAQQNMGKENVLGLGLDILNMYWSPSTKCKVLELILVFTAMFCDTDMVKDVGGVSVNYLDPLSHIYG
jgi:hypothetical protein